MTEKVECSTHGPREKAYVCHHLLGGSVGLGFNRDDPTADDPFPDAWCDDCEIIRADQGGWSEESETLTKISLLCSGCYERTRIRNTRTSITLNDLAALRWKCGTCEEWHTGACLDFGFNSPIYWQPQYEEVSRKAKPLPGLGLDYRTTFLDEDYCAIEDRDFFVRGLIELPILGTDQHFCWGVWGSLSRESFYALLKSEDDPNRAALPEMFSWLSNQIAEYPDTVNLKMYAHPGKPGFRPTFELEPTDHPLSREFNQGLDPRRVKEIMLARVPLCE